VLQDILALLISPEFWAAALRVATPVLIAAMGGLVAERAGMITFGMEGMMLMGCFAGVAAAFATKSIVVGFVAAMLAGVLVSMVYGVMIIPLRANQIVSAVALNLMVVGLTSYLNTMFFGLAADPVRVPKLQPFAIPLLSQIPIIGPIFFRQIPLVYLAYLLVPLISWVLFKTTWGLKIRSVGEHPHAADTVGISVYKVRFASLVVTGLLSGLAGAFLSLGQMGQFMEGMTGGRGYIAYTAIVFGKWTPVGTLLGSLLFGTADAFQLRLQALGMKVIPYQFLVALPYFATLIIVIFFVGKAAWPAASGLAFSREEK
jgi:general nucleoside transport system permease protein